jgi:hypothetical protein
MIYFHKRCMNMYSTCKSVFLLDNVLNKSYFICFIEIIVNFCISLFILRIFDWFRVWEIFISRVFARLATKRFSCLAKIRHEFREFRNFAKLPRLRKKRVSRNTKIAKTKKKIQNLTFFKNSFEDAR